MIRGSKEADSSTNEGSTSDGKIPNIASSSSSTWLRLKDPRIVRVSRAFGGKDRHSKVCTIRGLKDRRVRLSVPTAIQLYDLQDRLGLNQPSKVVDWLLNAAKHEIDELPPLPLPVPQPGNFGLNHHHQMLSSSQSNNNMINWELDPSDSLWRGKSKVVAERETTINDDEKGKQDHANNEDSSINLLPCGSYFQLEPSNVPLSHHHHHQLGGSHGLTSQTDHQEVQNFMSAVPLLGTTQPLFPSHVEIDQHHGPRQINHFHQMLSSNPHNLFSSGSLHSISQLMRPPFHFSMTTPRPLPPSSNNSGSSPSDKDQEFPSK